MFRPFVKYIDTVQFLRSLVGNELTAFGDPLICTRPLSLFVDTIPELEKLNYNDYNILLLYQPDNVSKMNEWVLENGDLFTCILTNNIDILNKWNTAYNFGPTSYDDMILKLKEFLYTIINENNIDESTYWSQELEDKWINENLILPDKGFFLDIGACHAKIISNTYFFEKSKGWNGLGIEPDPIFFSDLKKHRKCILEQIAISPTSGKAWCKPRGFGITLEKQTDSIEIECIRLDDLLNRHQIKEIDLISIDIEGYEEIAWSTFDYTKYNPKVIITEHTEFGKYDMGFTNKILQNKNYYIAHKTPLNNILVHKNVKQK